MKYCSKCGKELNDDAVICIGCGCAVEGPAKQTTTEVNDAPNGGFAALGFFIPIAGLILYLINMDTHPKRARSAGKGALIGVIVYVALIILYVIFCVVLFSTALGYSYGYWF